MKRFVAALLLVAFGAGCALFQSKPETKLWFHEQVNEATPAKLKREVFVPVSEVTVAIDPHPALTQRSIVAAEVIENAGGPAVLVKFDAHGMVVLDELTTRGRGQYLVVMLDDKPLVAWLIDKRITLGQFLIESNLTEQQARELVDSLRAIARKYHEGSTLLRAPW